MRELIKSKTFKLPPQPFPSTEGFGVFYSRADPPPSLGKHTDKFPSCFHGCSLHGVTVKSINPRKGRFGNLSKAYSMAYLQIYIYILNLKI